MGDIDRLAVRVYRQRNSRPSGVVAVTQFHVGLRIIHPLDGPTKDDVRHADTDGVAIGLVGQVADDDPLDRRAPPDRALVSHRPAFSGGRRERPFLGLDADCLQEPGFLEVPT
jgi:hypothetical protein